MNVIISVPGRDIIDVDLPIVPSINHSVALDGEDRLHKVVGVVWDLAPPAQRSGAPPYDIWVFCEPEQDQADGWRPTVIPFPKP